MSVNKVIILGNVGQDPRINTLDNGRKVATFSIATTDRSFTRQDGTVVPERTEWILVVVWGGLATIVEQYVKKGSKLYLEGKLRTRSYTDNNAITRYITEVYADNIELLSSASSARPLPPDPTDPTHQTSSAPYNPTDQPPMPNDLPF